MTQKTAQDIELDSPEIRIEPMEGLVQKAVEQLRKADPNYFKGVRTIRVAPQTFYGSVESGQGKDPSVINLNLDRIKQEVRAHGGSDEDIIHAIMETIAHEKGHVASFHPEQGFVGGEPVAEQEAKRMMDLIPKAAAAKYSILGPGEVDINGTPVRYNILNANANKAQVSFDIGQNHFEMFVNTIIGSEININGEWYDGTDEVDFKLLKHNPSFAALGGLYKYVTGPGPADLNLLISDLYEAILEDAIKRVAKENDIQAPDEVEASKYEINNGTIESGPGFDLIGPNYGDSAVCKTCGEDNPYADPSDDYECAKCKMMSEWARSASYPSFLVKLAHIYFLKAAMDVEQARQILRLPENASMADIDRAYKKLQHLQHLQSGSYDIPPEFGVARQVLLDNLGNKPAEDVYQQPQIEDPQEVSPPVEEKIKDTDEPMDFDEAWMLASSPQTPPDILDKLVNYDNYQVRTLALSNRNMPAETIEWAMQHPEAVGIPGTVLSIIANHHNTPSRLVSKLSGSSNDHIRSSVALRKDLDEGVAMDMAINDPSPAVLLSLARNDYVSGAVLRSIANRKQPTLNVQVYREIAVRKNAPIDVLENLAGSNDDITRMNVAGNKNTSVKTLKTLSNDVEWFVREAVARNQVTRSDILRNLLSDIDSVVQDAAAKNLQARGKTP